jgi:Xaa-Pro aminopeptidase
MAESRPGATEQELAGTVAGCYARHGCSTGYSTILSVRGEVLHNHSHGNTLRAGDLLLMDSGAERPSGSGADVTRAWPVTGEFSSEQRDVYRIVLDAQLASEEAVRPGARWLEVHLASARVIARGLVDLKLLNGDPDDLVARGAHTLFFPHGVGHFLGLDTHDLRVFGDRVLYPAGRKRSTEFGTDMLRMDPDLEPGMVVTVEPGIYFIPALIRGEAFRTRFPDAVNWERAAKYLEMNDGRGFGGVRIEDDLLVTEDGHRNLTPGIPKEPGEVEAAVRTAAWA